MYASSTKKFVSDVWEPICSYQSSKALFSTGFFIQYIFQNYETSILKMLISPLSHKGFFNRYCITLPSNRARKRRQIGATHLDDVLMCEEGKNTTARESSLQLKPSFHFNRFCQEKIFGFSLRGLKGSLPNVIIIARCRRWRVCKVVLEKRNHLLHCLLAKALLQSFAIRGHSVFQSSA